MQRDELKPNVVVQGPLFPEPVQVIVAAPLGTAIKLIGKGLRTNRVLAALYPTGTDERRWVEGVLARKRGLGL